jgi:geranylgeranyl pyrophosphate synthase
MLQLPTVRLPKAVPLQRERTPQENIPQSRSERERLRTRIRAFAALRKPVPPLRLEELRQLAGEFCNLEGVPAKYVDYVGVLLNSEVLRDALAAVPFERRLLLLPKCLREEEHCPAPFDEFGLLCKQCGLCSIQDLQEEAERLGYAVLVAEGSALVTALIATGKIEAIVGVSCLSVLEKAFPYMEAAAIPGVAIPLLQDDCKDVTVDLEWIWEVVHLTSLDRTYRMNLDGLREEVQTWFEPAVLEKTLGSATNETEALGQQWLANEGKRWRPFLAACVWKAFQEDPSVPMPDDLKRIAIAVECFHKASLIHDDIEDGDDLRYGEATLHASHGIPIALNVGDLLLGEGYRLIGECDAPGNRVAAMLRVASAGHRTLCLGQGDELNWARAPQPLRSGEVLDIFRRKTSPAFEVALRLGAILGGGDESIASVLSRYSNALGIAYQIRDDIQDMTEGEDPSDLLVMRPTLPLAILHERVLNQPADRALVERAWRRQCSRDELEQVRRLLETYEVEKRCQVLQESFKEEALRALGDLQTTSLKGLLRRVVSKIFSVELGSWCSEFETRNAPGGTAGAEDARGLDRVSR